MFSNLELAILRWFQQHYENECLTAQLESAKFIGRDWTEVGFFVYFEVPRTLPPVNIKDFRGYWPIWGPNIQSKDVQSGGGSILWGKEGYAECIEMYAYGDYFNEHVEDFELL